MGAERHGSKRGGGGGGYVGGFLQLFDWNAKSRKKLFSSKSDSPEHSKMKKRCDGNLPMTRYHLVEEDEMNTNTGSYSYASSMTDDEEFCVKPPGVVARLMGLDPLPPSSSNLSQFYSSTPFSEPCWRSRNQKAIATPIHKFQTEILPPKYAKTIPITHHKLLSPIKSASSILPENAAQIMEAAARIIEPSVTTRPKMPSLGGSCLAPLKVRDLKVKVESASRRVSGTNTTKCLNRSASKERVVVTSESEESYGGTKSKGKSISLALQAKENVLKREGLNNVSSAKEPSDLYSNQIMQRNNIQKKPSSAVSVLRQNNQKQNCSSDRGKPSSKPQGKRALTRDSSFSQHKSSTMKKSAESSNKISSRGLSLEMSTNKKEEIFFSNKNMTRKKQRSTDGNFSSGKKHSTSGNRSEELFQSCGLMDREGTNIVSFTFKAPLTRSTPINEISKGVEKNSSDLSADYRVKKFHHSPERISSLKSPLLAHDGIGGRDLSYLLEQKLRELTEKVEPSCQTSTILHDDPMQIDHLPVSQHHFVFSSTDSMEMTVKHKRQAVEGTCHYTKKLCDRRFPSPISVLENYNYSTESCNYSDMESNTTPSSKQSSSNHAQEIVGITSLNRLHSREADSELLDSASSRTSYFTEDRKAHIGKSPSEWELEYVKEIIGSTNLDLMMMILHAFSVKPHLYDLLECRKVMDGHGHDLRLERKVLFDCVSECLESMCAKYGGGCGYEMWAKGTLVVGRKDRLAEEVYREILRWSGLRDSMVDELVDMDMSNGSGKWLDFETEEFELGLQLENGLIDSLLDEVVKDMLIVL
ncbi:unnamed protein product [Cuscuta campestris]|uniref:DUF4378 domain-containing protein n=1 Tax=Cuscuta campestris TaxID=132261 RepID=A0A484K5T7_9ASTE|nr:unnamed protein product [Cuscuta campestris]